MRRKDLKEAKKVLQEVQKNPCTEHEIKIKTLQTGINLNKNNIIIVNRVSFVALLASALSIALHFFF